MNWKKNWVTIHPKVKGDKGEFTSLVWFSKVLVLRLADQTSSQIQPNPRTRDNSSHPHFKQPSSPVLYSWSQVCLTSCVTTKWILEDWSVNIWWNKTQIWAESTDDSIITVQKGKQLMFCISFYTPTLKLKSGLSSLTWHHTWQQVCDIMWNNHQIETFQSAKEQQEKTWFYFLGKNIDFNTMLGRINITFNKKHVLSWQKQKRIQY